MALSLLGSSGSFVLEGNEASKERKQIVFQFALFCAVPYVKDGTIDLESAKALVRESLPININIKLSNETQYTIPVTYNLKVKHLLVSSSNFNGFNGGLDFGQVNMKNSAIQKITLHNENPFNLPFACIVDRSVYFILLIKGVFSHSKRRHNN